MSAREQPSWAWRNPPDALADPRRRPEPSKVDHPLAARVLLNAAARNPQRSINVPPDPMSEGMLVEVFDSRHGFWRVGTVLSRAGCRKWVRVSTPAGVFKVEKLPTLVRPLA